MQDLPTLHASHLAQIITLTSTITHPNGTSNTSAPAANTDKFDLQRSALQLYADATTRSELHFWREEWLELVGLEIGGWEPNAGGSDEGGSVRKGGRSSRAGSVDPGIRRLMFDKDRTSQVRASSIACNSRRPGLKANGIKVPRSAFGT